MNITSLITKAMIGYDRGNVHRIHHFLKVFGFARTIGELEGLDPDTQEILEAAALVHDIGIRLSEEKYQSSAGHHQQIEGPPEAEKMLAGLLLSRAKIERICFLIAHHHDDSSIREIDHQILVEADFLVNAYEGHLSSESISHVRESLFKTDHGKLFLDQLYQL